MFIKVKEGYVVDDGKKVHKPGAIFNPTAAEAKRLLKLGVVSKTTEDKEK